VTISSSKNLLGDCFVGLRPPRNDTCYLQNKSPFASALGDCFLKNFFLIKKASPNGWLAIIIVIIVVVGKAIILFHKLAYYSTNLTLISAPYR
jgi:hypothetical protein